MTQAFAVLGAWLHDIGKFAQRAGAPAAEGMAQEYCPSDKQGRSTHLHVLYTDYFIEHHLPLPPELADKRSHLARLAAAHHRPDAASRAEMALQKADCLSSGGDRLAGDAEGGYKTARLESIFSAVQLENNKGRAETAPFRYRLAALDAADGVPIFPCADTRKTDSYAELYQKFRAALAKIPLDMGVRHYLHSLATVLERFTWCIPSSTYHTRADISLYDHAATTAAITQALLACPQGQEKFLLCGGDLSGIQKYIFGTEEHADKGASKLLRARSFLLQALTRSLWLALLDRLELTSAAKIMDAGGRFILLLPDTAEARKILEAWKYEAEQWLLENFQGVLRLNSAWLAIKPDDLQRERFRVCFEQFNDALEQAKLRPFDTLLKQGLSPVLPVDHEAYRQFGECELCHARPAAAPRTEDDGTAACEQCRRLITQIGRRLPRARYLVFDRKADGLPLFGGLFLHLEEAAPRAWDALDIISMRDREAFSAVPVAGFVPAVRKDDLDRWREEGRLHEQDGTPMLGGEPCPEGAPKTFAMLAEESRIRQGSSWRSIPCLAACKADVDNLGMLFGVGFGTGEDSLFSISRFAMLSRMLNHFFAAHLIRVIAEEFPNIYVIFAGGDDLFVLGPWAETVRFAERLHQDFTAFSGGNPAVTLSAGLPVVKPRLPMRALRDAAEKALEASKRQPQKDAATLFDVSARWQLFHMLLECGGWLEQLCLDGLVTQGLVRRMLGYSRECRDFNNGDVSKGLYLSHMAYDMARNCDAKRMGEDTLRALQAMGQDKNFPRAAMGITWALYRTRISG